MPLVRPFKKKKEFWISRNEEWLVVPVPLSYMEAENNVTKTITKTRASTFHVLMAWEALVKMSCRGGIQRGGSGEHWAAWRTCWGSSDHGLLVSYVSLCQQTLVTTGGRQVIPVSIFSCLDNG